MTDKDTENEQVLNTVILQKWIEPVIEIIELRNFLCFK